jgi:outer membrane protein assembly factor BamB
MTRRTSRHFMCTFLLGVLATASVASARFIPPVGPGPNAQETDPFWVAPWTQSWTHLAGGPRRIATTIADPRDLQLPRWVANKLPNGTPIAFNTQSGVVADAGVVLAVGETNGLWRLVAFTLQTGRVRWHVPVPAPVFSSWATPVIDRPRDAALVGSGSWVMCFDLTTGAMRWQAPLYAGIVNASIVVTNDIEGANRAFITDFDGGGVDALLYCINLDPFTPANPFSPGEVVWAAPIGGSSGNTPAYANRTVYVASNAGSYEPGSIYAFPADTQSQPGPLWRFDNPEANGFFGGVCVARRGGQEFVYAASYGFVGGLTAGNLVKVDAATGALVWTIPCNRTSSIPVPLPDGRVILSGGIHNFGSIPSIECFMDNGSTVSALWTTALQTWCDKNGNGFPDPDEFIEVGGWTTQPLASRTLHGPWRIYVGALPKGGFNAPYNQFVRINLDRTPSESTFIEECREQFGNTPALADEFLVTTGPGGLAAF